MPRQKAARVRLRALDLPLYLCPPDCLSVSAGGSFDRGVQGRPLRPAVVFWPAVELGRFGCRHLKLIYHLPEKQSAVVHLVVVPIRSRTWRGASFHLSDLSDTPQCPGY
jgi:hypothetical protein